ncbi:alpha/beta fold hydrolase [Ornithinimicrobium ciconiae]|uniref:Alpha/beta fold hydrolase n=1 Tax=Ornithinimicrobium ciconiae TaxID=2594265 RepID=A0A516GB30_9MICO|nr:alpha/beta fold hydrolase [Ornithinimicrobium ciconiae]QDO88717.1 alpha/beta fold hydrolase [Ornithinimicrobium ciconiae]
MSDPQSLSIHTTVVGESTPSAEATRWVVFLHGLFGQGKNFTTIAKALQPEFVSLLVDLPNHGRSDWTETVDYEQMADAVAAQVRRTVGDDQRIHLVGHSMGGKVAMALALRHRDLIDRLVIVDISPASSTDMSEFEQLLGALATLDLDDLPSRTEADARLSELIPNRTTRGFLLQNLRSEGERWRWQANLDLLLADLPTVGGYVPEGDPFTGPVLWVAGERSNYIQPEHRPAMEELFPRTVLVRVKGAGHWVHSQQPQAFTSALRTFLTAT